MDSAAASKQWLHRLPSQLERLQNGVFSRHQGCISIIRSCGPVLQTCTGGFNNCPWVVWLEKAWESGYPVIPGDLRLLYLAALMFPTTLHVIAPALALSFCVNPPNTHSLTHSLTSIIPKHKFFPKLTHSKLLFVSVLKIAKVFMQNGLKWAQETIK
ncbi:hypothetical protein GOODEAATRI_014407 [Goodea atripinnis]|uniref:Uncharacterized protein n=1 Tax=Goodea atripinnis TaxID=208336 RepID=A0ABV0N1C2_9TELE